MIGNTVETTVARPVATQQAVMKEITVVPIPTVTVTPLNEPLEERDRVTPAHEPPVPPDSQKDPNIVDLRELTPERIVALVQQQAVRLQADCSTADQLFCMTGIDLLAFTVKILGQVAAHVDSMLAIQKTIRTSPEELFQEVTRKREAAAWRQRNKRARDRAATADSSAKATVAEEVTTTSAALAAVEEVVRQELRARDTASLEVSR